MKRIIYLLLFVLPLIGLSQVPSNFDEQPYGILYNQSSWVNATTGFTNHGSTFTVPGTTLHTTVGASNYSQSLGINGPSMLDAFVMYGKFTVGTKSATTTDGFGIGKQSVNWYSASNAIGRFYMSSGAGSGKIELELATGNGTVSAASTSATALTFSIGDNILMTYWKNEYLVVLTARNLTTNSASISCSYFYQTLYGSIPFIFDNTGLYSVFACGGTFDVDSLAVSSNVSTHAKLAIIGDSKTQGYYVSDQSVRFADQLNQNIRSTINLSGTSDRLIEISARIQEIINLQPYAVWNLGGSNDKRSGRAAAVYNAEYDSICTALAAHGILVLTGVLYETSVNLDSLNNHIVATYPAPQYIDVYDATKQPNILQPDNIHLTDYGNSVAYNTAVNFPAFAFNNTRWVGPQAGPATPGIVTSGQQLFGSRKTFESPLVLSGPTGPGSGPGVGVQFYNIKNSANAAVYYTYPDTVGLANSSLVWFLSPKGTGNIAGARAQLGFMNTDYYPVNGTAPSAFQGLFITATGTAYTILGSNSGLSNLPIEISANGATPQLYLSASGATAPVLINNATNNGIGQIEVTSTTLSQVGGFYDAADYFALHATSTGILVIGNTGANIQMANHTVPFTTTTYDLGSSSLAWRDIYFSHTISESTMGSSNSTGTNVTSATASGSDEDFQITLVTSGAVAGTLADLTFGRTWIGRPHCSISAANAATGSAVATTVGGYVGSNATSTSNWEMVGAITTSGTYVFNCHCGQ